MKKKWVLCAIVCGAGILILIGFLRQPFINAQSISEADRQTLTGNRTPP